MIQFDSILSSISFHRSSQYKIMIQLFLPSARLIQLDQLVKLIC